MTNRTLILVFSLIFWSQMIAQPAQFYFGDLGKDQIAQMIPSTDGNFLATGSKMIDSQQQIWLLKVNKDGVVLWEKTFLPSDPDISGFGHSLTVLTNGQIIISAEERTKESFSAGLGIVIKTDANGDEIWTKTYSDIEAVFDAIPFGDSLLLVGWRDQTGASNIGFVMMVNEDGTQQWLKDVIISSKNKVRRIFPTDDGNFILLGRANVIGAGFAGIYLQKIDSNGTLIWQKTLDTGWREPNMYGDINYYNQPLGAVQMPDGTFWIVNPLTSLSDVLLLHFSEEGELLSQKKYGDPSLVEEPYGLTALPDGGWLITGESYNNSSKDDQVKGFAMQVDSNGLDLWRQYYGEGVVMNRLFSGVALDDGQLLMGGASTSTTGNGDSDGWLLRTDADGNALPWTITGQIIIDENNNCLADPGEQVAKGWFIEVTDTATQYVITDDQGQFQIRTGDGTMTLKAIKPQPSDIWQFCSDSQTMTSNSNNPVGQLTFLAQAIDGGCAHLEVGITQPDLMRCETSTFIVTVQNRGSGVSEENLLELVSDPEFTILSASEPYFQNGNIIEFDIDPMDSFQQKSIAIKVQLSCDVQVGATHEMVARILPGKCTPLWDGPRFTVQGFCGGDEVVFFLNNDGGGGSLAQSRYRVISDYLLHTDWTEVVLPEGGLPLSLSFPADGRSWRVELEQAPNFPTDSHPAAAIEGCGTGNNGLHAIAFRNAWRFDDGMPEVSAVLAPNTTGVPNRIAEACPGMSEHNFISNADWLEFTARVQNPFPTTVGSAIFRFSFSTNLDLSTFQVVASNGPVDMKMENQKFITTRMNGLQIEPGGMFMVRFRIRPIEGTLPDMWQDSYFSVNGDAYVDNHGPFPLIQGFNRYSVEIPSPEDIDNTYPPEILLYGGRDSEFGVNMTLAKDGNVFLIGDSQSYSDNSNTDGFIIKADTKGRAYWLKAIDLGDQGSNSFKG
ncbi:MAG: hypothetical protein KDC19_14585, partial [Saprospiraceae bacterium]|nr:hypothetical protein [Saprospiraceae bacterium]